MAALLIALMATTFPSAHAGTAASPELIDPVGDTFGPAPYADLTAAWFTTIGGGSPSGFTFSFRTVRDPDSSPAPLRVRASWSLGHDGHEPCWGGITLDDAGAEWTGSIEHHCDGTNSTMIGFVQGGAQSPPVYESSVAVDRDSTKTTVTVLLSAFADTPMAALYHAGQTLSDIALSIGYAGLPSGGRGAGSIDGAPDACTVPLGDRWVCQSGAPLRDDRPQAASFVLGE